MKSYFVIILLLVAPMLIQAQDPEGSYNPYVNAGIITPSPLYPIEVNGTGEISFNIGNSGSDPLEIYSDQYITLTISLSNGEPDNVSPLAAIGGSAAGFFDWSYSGGTYTAIQNTTLPADYSASITIAYKVTQNSLSPGSNGFNVNITPAPYQTGSNSRDDDAVSSYTYTEIRDFGDAPAVYGSVDHIMDFSNYLGAEVDGEPGNLSSAAADGDDLDGLDDEDGVVFPAEMHRSENVNIAVTVTGLGYLNAWIDWNADGDFDDIHEQVASNVQRLSGTQNLNLTVPDDATLSVPVFARFRFSPGSVSSPNGSVNGGEVEDYQISILCMPPEPSLSISSAAFCEGENVSLTAGGGSLYLFRVDGITAQDGASATYTTDSLQEGQIVDVIVTDEIGCSATSDPLDFNVYALPVATISSSDVDNEFCEGTEITFSASGGEVYDFRIDGVSVQNGTNSSFVTSDLANNQTLDVIVIDENSCEAVSSAITNIIHPLPSISFGISDADSAFCVGSSIVFDASGGSNYNFRVDGLSVQNSSQNTYTTNTLSDGQTIDVIVSDANACEATSGIITTTVFDLPLADAGPAASDICQGSSSLELEGSVSGSATGGVWSSPAGGSFDPGADALNATWTPPPGFSGTATLTLTTTGGECGVASESKTLVVNPLPVLLVSDPDPVCAPGTVDLTLPAVTEGSTAGLSYTYWSDAEATIALTNPDAVEEGTYYIMGTLALTGCSVIAPVTVSITPRPATPLVDVIDNCNGTSFLSTTAAGSLLWNTGATSTSILVNTAGTYTVTSSIDGCESLEGSGFASPNTAPAAPIVTDPTPVNECPDLSVDLASYISSSAPAGGAVLYKTSDDPEGTDVTDPSAVGAGVYYVFYMSPDGCYSAGSELTVTINPCPPDLTITLVASPNIMHGVTSFDLVVRVTELNNEDTNGPIVVNIPKDARWTIPGGFSQSLTELLGSPLNNIDWTYSEDAVNHTFTSNAVIPAGSYSNFGLSVTFDPGSTRGIYTITSQLVSGAGGELRVGNNVDSEKISYFQE